MAKTKKTEETKGGWDVLHIFGYGATQINGDTEKKVLTSELTTAQAIIDFVYGKKPADSDAGTQFHVISFVKDHFARYIPKNTEEKVFHIKFDELDAKLFADFLAEVEAKAEPISTGLPKLV